MCLRRTFLWTLLSQDAYPQSQFLFGKSEACSSFSRGQFYSSRLTLLTARYTVSEKHIKGLKYGVFRNNVCHKQKDASYWALCAWSYDLGASSGKCVCVGGCFSVLKKCCVNSRHKQRREIKRRPLLVPTTFLEAPFSQVKGGTEIWRVRREMSLH